jgi:5-methylthioadenosine/S-adenosylhomocysteine deaminase
MTMPDGPQTCDILIRNGIVITMDPGRRIYAQGAIAVQGQHIVAVGREGDIEPHYVPTRTVDAKGGVVHPGFIEPHLHVVHGTGRGVYGTPKVAALQAASFPDWKAGVTSEDEKVATELCSLELLRHGFTMFIEPGTVFDGEAVAAGANAAGVRALLCGPYLWDQIEPMKHTGGLESQALYDRAPPSLDRCLRQLDREIYRNRDPDALVRGYVGVYGMGTASDALLKAAKARADEAGVIFQEHENYTKEGTLADTARLGGSRIAHLDRLGLLGPNVSLVHMNMLQSADIPLLVESRTSIVWCPISTLRFGHPHGLKCWAPDLLAMGGNVALALDGPLDSPIGTASRLAFLVSAGLSAPVGPEDILEMQTLRAAVVAGMASELGSIESGKRADLVVRSPSAIEGYPGTNVVHQIALTAEAGSVETVLVNGTIVLEGGVSTRLDERRVFARGRESVERRLGRLGLSPGFAWPVVH